MNHSFNTAIAKRLGIEEAILIENIAFWIKKNIANRKNFHNNKCYTYSSVKAFSELFEYMTERKISYCLKKLEENQIIESGNFNKNKYDRTKHYTIIDKEICEIYEIDYSKCADSDEDEYENEDDSSFDKNVKSIGKDCQIEMTRLSNRNDTIVEPIPYIKKDIEKDIKKDIKKDIEKSRKKIAQSEIALLFYDIVENGFKLDNKLYDINKLLEFVIDTVNNTLDIPNLNQYIISLVNIYSDRFIYKN